VSTISHTAISPTAPRIPTDRPLARAAHGTTQVPGTRATLPRGLRAYRIAFPSQRPSSAFRRIPLGKDVQIPAMAGDHRHDHGCLTVSATYVQPMTVTQDGQWRLPPSGELQLPFRLVGSCPALSETCLTAAGPRTGTFSSRAPPITAPPCISAWRLTCQPAMWWRQAEPDAGLLAITS
jgi:hypothetical protein